MRTHTQPRPFTPEDVGLLVDRAGRAPSVHNTQPWSFRVRDTVVELYADDRRALAVADPQGREQLISCGAALFNLRLTMLRLGHEPLVTLLPDGVAGRRLAVVERGPARPATPDEKRLYDQIVRRRTQRRPFDGRKVSEPRRRRLETAAMSEKGWVRFIDDPVPRRRIAQLMASAAAADAADPAYNAELNKWLRCDEMASDGIPVQSLGTAPYPIDGLPRRAPQIAEWLTEVVEDELTSSTVLILCSVGDTPRDWLGTGQALQHLLLEATGIGLVSSFANQLIELPELRAKLRAVLAATGYPQLLLRIGHPLIHVPATPRRDTAQLFAALQPRQG